MTDHYEMPHPDADACAHAGVGKACRPCREVLDNLHRINLRDTPVGRALMAEGWEEGTLNQIGRGYVGNMNQETISIIRERIADANPYLEADA